MRRYVLVLLLAACGSDTPEAGKTGTYVRPPIRELIARAKPAGSVATPARVFQTLEDARARPAFQAVWEAVKKAEDEGLLELYGVESFDLDGRRASADSKGVRQPARQDDHQLRPARRGRGHRHAGLPRASPPEGSAFSPGVFSPRSRPDDRHYLRT